MSEAQLSGASARPFLIRRAVPADDAALGGLDRRTWSTLHAVQPEPPHPETAFFDDRHRPEEFLVAEAAAAAAAAADAGDAAEERIAGYIRVVPPSPLPAHAHVRQIQGLVVDRWARGRGLARALLDAACEEARRQGARRLTLRVLGHNTPARRLYESAGFEVEGVLPDEFRLAGRYVDDVLMGRGL